MKITVWPFVAATVLGVLLASSGVPERIAISAGFVLAVIFGVVGFFNDRELEKQREHELEVARLMSKQTEIVPLTRADE